MFTVSQRIRIEWSHCDRAGIIFNPHYYVWMDQGTHSLLRAAGFDLFREVGGDNDFIGCPLVASQMDFKQPLQLGDITTLHSRVSRFGTRSFTVAHRFERAGATVASGSEVRIWGYGDATTPGKLRAEAIPETIVTLLSARGHVDTSP